MKTLEHPDSWFVETARSLLRKGRCLAAERVVNEVGASSRPHPDVLEVRWCIQAQSKRWRAALQISEKLVLLAPERPTGWVQRSFILHKLNRNLEALDCLLPAVERFPDIPVIYYNLACYAAWQDSWAEAECWLKQAMQVGGDRYYEMALREKALRPLWRPRGN